MKFAYDFTDVHKTILYTFAIACAYTIVLIAFIIYVVMEFEIVHGYPRHADLRPGPFVSDRYTWSWYFLVSNFSRGLIIWYGLSTLINMRSNSNRLWYDRFIGLIFLWDIILWIYFIITACFLCNNSYYPSESSLCNDIPSKLCTVFGDHLPDRCPPSLPGAEQCDLEMHPIFFRWIIFHVLFTLLDWGAGRQNEDMTLHLNGHRNWKNDDYT